MELQGVSKKGDDFKYEFIYSKYSKYNTKQVHSNESIHNIINTFEKKVQSAVYLINRKKISEKRLNVIKPVQNLISAFPSLLIRKTASAVGFNQSKRRFVTETVQITRLAQVRNS